jgi:hypothetical protein
VKWEYTLLMRVDIEKRGGGDFVAGLNKLGEEGWEVISMTGPRGTHGYGETLFKRPKESPRGAPGGLTFRGGSEGSRTGGATNPFDPGILFDRMATGRATIKISEMRLFQEGAQAWAKKQGITNGQLTREQFAAFLQSPETRQAMQQRLAQFQGGAGAADDHAPRQAVKVIRLKHAKATSLLGLLQELYGQKEHLRMASDDRTNSLVLVGAATPLVEVVALIEQLDVPGDAKPAK